ncbi:MAG: 23S rRNA (guanosine(2251)-2'-O)-methyltransferase RlmB [Candidatus Methylomirabilales bacterium]
MARADGSGEAPDLLYGLHAVREALRGGVRPLLRLLVVREDRQFADLVRMARVARVPVHTEPQSVFDRLVPHRKHQGVIGLIAAKPYAELEAILGAARQRGEPPFLVILDGVEDPRNLGAVLRTAEAAGVHGVMVPERRSAGLTGAVAKAAAGALEHLQVGRVKNVSRLIEALQTEGLWVYALDPRARKLYTALDLRGPVALVFGGEGKGVRPGVLDKCDDRAGIPMVGCVESLNVSVAAGILMYEVLRQRLSNVKIGEK